MILTITTTHRPATDLGFLLHKHPDRVHTVDLSFGQARVLYPEASDERCSASLIIDFDPVGLVRGQKDCGRHEFALSDYVNDRPYAASSFLSVAMAKVLSTAMSGTSKERPELVGQAIPLEAALPVVPARGGESVVRRLFEPLGYQVDATPIPVDTEFPEWENSRYLSVRLRATTRLRDLLDHLFVLLPVLDDDKHYWAGADEVDKLMRRGGDWLPSHPERQLIAARYLRHDQALAREALARLSDEEQTDPDRIAVRRDAEEAAIEAPISLNDQRLNAVANAITANSAQRIIDFGCGEGRLLQTLLQTAGIQQVVGVDVSHRALEIAARRLHLEDMAPRQRQRIDLIQGSLTYRDHRFEGFDAAALVEVIEHVEPSRLASLERVVFAHARPALVVLTTPNAEYNPRFESLPAGALRHRDHRFEWTRAELSSWAEGVAERHGYTLTLAGIGPDDPQVGAPTQMAVFSR